MTVDLVRRPLSLAAPPEALHFVGASGAGMSALARLFLAAGTRITGSDLDPRPALRALGLNTRILRGHDERYLPKDADAVVRTVAVPDDNPEIAAALARGVPVLAYDEAVRQATLERDVCAVAGTHGKTTTAALLTRILERTGFEPASIIGGHVPEFGGGALVGGGPVVVEACEFAGTIRSLRPRHAIVTNIAADHMDRYRGMAALRKAFRRLARSVPPDGVIVCPEPVALELELDRAIPGRLVTVGRGQGRVRMAHDGLLLSLSGAAGTPWGCVPLPMPGDHNAWNTALAVVLARAAWGVSVESSAAALAGFRGVERRFEVRHESREAVVVDDYAHHPDEVEVTLRTARIRFPGRRVVAIFQPHLASRTDTHFEGFLNALASADMIVLVADYRVAGRETEAGEGASRMAEIFGRLHAPVVFAPDVASVTEMTLARARHGDVFCIMGAGDVREVASELVDGLH